MTRTASHPHATHAAILCGDVPFRTFLFRAKGEATAITAQGAAQAVRKLCKVASRREFDEDPAATRRWRDLVAEFKAWSRAP